MWPSETLVVSVECSVMVRKGILFVLNGHLQPRGLTLSQALGRFLYSWVPGLNDSGIGVCLKMSLTGWKPADRPGVEGAGVLKDRRVGSPVVGYGYHWGRTTQQPLPVAEFSQVWKCRGKQGWTQPLGV